MSETIQVGAGVDAGSRGFRFVRLVARLMLRSQYRRIEVDGAEKVPSGGAVLLVANHFLSLVDTMALFHASPRPASFLAKAPLWKSVLLRPFLDAVGAVPVYRPQDQSENEGRSVRANLEVFRRCRERLVAGGSLALFPEGISHSQFRLMPLRTGASRIAIDTGQSVAVCPAGLVFRDGDDGRRGTVLVCFGDPIHVNGTAGYANRRSAIAGVTRRIEESLRGLLAEADSASDIAKLETLGVVWRQERGEPEPETLIEAHRQNRAFAAALSRLRSDAPKALDQLRSTTDGYQRSLDEAGIPATRLEDRYDAKRVLRFLLLRAPWLLVALPVGLLAAMVTWPVRQLGDVIALRQFGGTQDVRSLCRMFGATLLLVLLTIGGALVAGWFWGWKISLLALLGLPALLVFFVVWRDTSGAAKTSLRCWALLAGSNLRTNLRRQRRALYERLLTVGAHLRGGQAAEEDAARDSRSSSAS